MSRICKKKIPQVLQVQLQTSICAAFSGGGAHKEQKNKINVV
jgi:hypothetical protein